jgi:hypothetical protein
VSSSSQIALINLKVHRGGLEFGILCMGRVVMKGAVPAIIANHRQGKLTLRQA